MKNLFLALLSLSVFSLLASDSHSVAKKSKSETNARPLFTENKGQVRAMDGTERPDVKFVFNDVHAQVFLLQGALAYQFTRVHYPEGYRAHNTPMKTTQNLERLRVLSSQIRTETFRMDMTLVGADANARIIAEGRSADYLNYYQHNAFSVHSFQKITYKNVYPGIDWVIYANVKNITYDFIIHPGADPSLIKLKISHQESLSLNADGGLTLGNRMGEVHEQKPVSFQGSTRVETQFVIYGDEICFKVGSYDRSKTLIIDPPVAWSTYYGGPGEDFVESCDTDAAGNVYAAGLTTSASNIAAGGHQVTYGGGNNDVYLVKFNTSGVRQWASYYGGSALDLNPAVAVDGSGNVYLTGSTTSSGLASGGFQNALAGGYDAFLVKFDANGNRIWATYYGGSGNDYGVSCTTDGSGNVYLTGTTKSTNDIATAGVHQPAHAAMEDAFIVKFDGNGNRQWASYFGGEDIDEGAGCALDKQGNIFIVGSTRSNFGIALAGHQNTHSGGYNFDGFIAKFDNSGILQWASFYGAVENDYAVDCATDPSGNIYMCGSASSSVNISTTNSNFAYTSAYLAKFNNNGTRLWGTYVFSGNSNRTTYGYDCDTDLGGNVFIAGWDLFFSEFTADLMRYDPAGAIIDGATVSGSADDETGGAVAADIFGNVYFGGGSGSGDIASAGHQNGYGGGPTDGFLVKYLCLPPDITVSVEPRNYCDGEPIPVSATPALQYSWPGGATGATAAVTPSASGIYTVTGIDSLGCVGTKEFFLGTIPCLGLDAYSQTNSQPLLFPNPSAALYTLQVDHKATGVIYNSVGQQISQQSFHEGNNQIDLGAFKPGVYLLVLESNGIKQQVKMVRE